MLSAEESECTVQAVHAADPVVSLKVPVGQLEQTPPSGPENPTLHLQSECTALPLVECESTGQPVHAPGPGSALYVPAAHCEHADGLVAIAAKAPGMH